MTFASRSAVLALALIGTLSGVPRFVFAEATPADKASARELMREGRQLRDAGDHDGALRKYRAAYAVVPSPVTGLACARELIALGQLTEARELLSELNRLPVTSTETDEGRKARGEVATLLTEISAKIPVVEVAVHGVDDDRQITLEIDGRTVPAIAAAEGWRVNPGTHAIVARAPQRIDQVATVRVAEGERKKIELTFPPPTATKATPKSASTPTPPASTSPTAPATTPAPIAAQPDSSSSGGTMRWVGIGSAGAGVIAMGIGGLVALSAHSSYSDAKSNYCGTGTCTDEGKRLTDDARTRADRAGIVIGIGAAVAVGGVVLWLTAPSDTRKTGVTSVSVGAGTITVGGSF